MYNSYSKNNNAYLYQSRKCENVEIIAQRISSYLSIQLLCPFFEKKRTKHVVQSKEYNSKNFMCQLSWLLFSVASILPVDETIEI